MSITHNTRLSALAYALSGYQGDDFIDTTKMVRDYRLHQHASLHDIYTGTAQAQAAVLIIISDTPTPQVLFTRRSIRLNSHAGEVSFVGGKKDDNDPSIIHTALREAQEEIGLSSQDVKILGTLPMQLSKAGLLVRPVVACIDAQAAASLQPSADEISRLFWVALDYFLTNPPQEHRFDISKDLQQLNAQHQPTATTLLTPAWCVADEVIWGMTARILANMLHIGYGTNHAWYYRLT